MGRRGAKTRKHKKLKFVDPCYSGPPRYTKKRKLLPNEPPTEENCQEIPSTMQHFIDVKSEAQQNKLKKRRKKKKQMKDDFIIVKCDKIEDNVPGMTKILKPLPEKVEQEKGETQMEFFNRLQKMADLAIAEAKIEQKYNLDLIHVDKSGNTHFITAEKQAGTMKKEKRKKYEERKKKKVKTDESEEFKKDIIQFGEVVLEPPTLASIPKNAVQTKAGKRKLVLHELLHEESNTVNDLTKSKKLKLLSPDERKRLESERLRVVDLYRSMKKKKT